MRIKIVLIFISFIFSGPYVSHDLSAKYEWGYTLTQEFSGFGTYTATESEKSEISSAITVGFEKNLKGKLSGIAPGVSFDIKPMKKNGLNYRLANAYLKYYIKIKPKFLLWGLGGYGHPLGDLEDEDWEGGYVYGFGAKLKDISIGCVYSHLQKSENTYYDYANLNQTIEEEIMFTRIIVSYYF